MVLKNTKLLFLFFFPACSGFLSPEADWERDMSVVDHSWTTSNDKSLEPMKLPEFLIVSESNDHKQDLKPEKGAREIPNWLKKVLLGIPQTLTDVLKTTHPQELIDVLCHLDKIYVRIRRDFFKSADAFRYLKLGSCSVNYRNKDYYFLMYSLKTDCGFKKESSPDYLSISIRLNYKPTISVLRESPFDVSLQCRYPRWFYSYKVGYHPKLQGGTLYKALQAKHTFSISPQDVSGNETPGKRSYDLGHPMYFEASGPEQSTSHEDKRIYISKCFVTSSKDPYSHLNHTVIDNQGCMVDSKLTMESKFIAGDSKMVQKFSMNAFVFEGGSINSPQQFYMHCKMSFGPLTPTQSLKACNYDHATHKWKELYGKDSVCKCCKSTCSPAKPGTESESLISSYPWRVEFSSEDEVKEVDLKKKSHVETENLEDLMMEKFPEFPDCVDDRKDKK